MQCGAQRKGMNQQHDSRTSQWQSKEGCLSTCLSPGGTPLSRHVYTMIFINICSYASCQPSRAARRRPDNGNTTAAQYEAAEMATQGDAPVHPDPERICIPGRGCHGSGSGWDGALEMVLGGVSGVEGATVRAWVTRITLTMTMLNQGARCRRIHFSLRRVHVAEAMCGGRASPGGGCAPQAAKKVLR